MDGDHCDIDLVGHGALSQKFFWLVFVFCLGLASACDRELPESDHDPITTQSSESAAPQRIITLSPHLTELVFSLGAEERLVATVAYSDYPQAAKNIPRIGDAFRIDWERLAQLKPDLILVWEGGNPQSLLEELERKNYSVHALKNSKLFALPAQLLELEKILGVDDVAADLAEQYSQGLLKLQQDYSNKKLIKVFYQVASEPLYTVDGKHVISEMLAVCGGVNVFNDIGSIAAPVSAEAVLAAQPDVIITSHEMREAVVENWSVTQLVKADNILSVSPDEVARASLRMLQGTRNICEVLDAWRKKKLPESGR